MSTNVYSRYGMNLWNFVPTNFYQIIIKANRQKTFRWRKKWLNMRSAKTLNYVNENKTSNKQTLMNMEMRRKIIIMVT